MKHKYTLFFLIIIAFGIRLFALNQSLWLDEATTAQTIKHYSYLDLLMKFAPTDFHPPLYYWFMKAWTGVFGYSEIALRMPSVLFSIATGWVVYLIGKKLKDFKTGVWAAAFFLFNPLIVYYSQEARMYMMVTFFLTIVLYIFLKLAAGHSREGGNLYNIILVNLFIALSLFTFYGSVFFIAGLYVYILKVGFMDSPHAGQARLRGNDKKASNISLLLSILPGTVIALLMLSPLLLKQYIHAKQMLSLVPHWNLVLGKANAKNLFLIPLKFSIGRIQFNPKIMYYAASAIWTSLVFLYIFIGSFKNRMLGILFFAPLFLGFIFSFFTPLLQYFRFLYLIPVYAILFVIGQTEEYKRWMYLVVFILFSGTYLFLSQFHRENWKVLAKTVHNGDTVYMIYSSSDPLQYYLEQNHIKASIKDLHDIETVKQKKIVVIPYTADIFGISYKKGLENKGYQIVIQHDILGLSADVWLK